MCWDISLYGDGFGVGGVSLKIAGGIINGGITNFVFPKDNEKDATSALSRLKEFEESDKYHYSFKIVDEVKITYVNNYLQIFKKLF
jgi:predicted ATP-dependent protease